MNLEECFAEFVDTFMNSTEDERTTMLLKIYKCSEEISQDDTLPFQGGIPSDFMNKLSVEYIGFTVGREKLEELINTVNRTENYKRFFVTMWSAYVYARNLPK
jgi:hypothetical protein